MNNKISIENLRILCANGKVKWTLHALKRIRERGINSQQVINAILSGEIIEEYPDDTPFPSCLIYAVVDGNQVHVVLSSDGECIYFITSYSPNLNEWEEDFKTRKGKL